jgi:hypothetical protein
MSIKSGNIVVTLWTLWASNDSISHMSFFGKKNKKRVELIWGVVSVLVAISMVLLYMPIFNQ